MRFHLSWRENEDSLDVGLAAHRLLYAGRPVRWCQASGGAVESGDYLLEGEPGLAGRLAGLGLTARRWSGPLPRGTTRLAPPRVALLAGSASAYPYFAYYALCLLRLGVDYTPVGGGEIAAGGLEAANLLILPGGFAIWGLDVAEKTAGADAAVRRFLARGGACLGSCGGAYYLSAGRPGWTGTARVRPRYTHEYLQTGTGIVAVALGRGPLRHGLPGSVELPYYHGPVYEEPPAGVGVAGRFRSLCLPGRLGIDNPLEAGRFAREMAGRPAILLADGPRGRAVLFSAHPEMGDLLRKYIALDGYVRKYLPIRGRRTMAESLAAYRPLDAPAFRLVLNAVHHLTAGPGAPTGRPDLRARPGAAARAGLATLRRAADRRLAAVRVPRGAAYAGVVGGVAEALRRRLRSSARALAPRLRRSGDPAGAGGRTIRAAWDHLAAAGAAGLGGGGGAAGAAAEDLCQVELAICLMEATRRALEFDEALAGTTREARWT